MNTALGLLILGEIALTLFIVYCFMNEKKLIAIENNIIRAVKANAAHRRAAKADRNREKFNSRVVYTPVKPRRRPGSSSREAA